MITKFFCTKNFTFGLIVSIDKEVEHNIYTDDTVKKYLRGYLEIRVFHFDYRLNFYLFPPELDIKIQSYDNRIKK